MKTVTTIRPQVGTQPVRRRRRPFLAFFCFVILALLLIGVAVSIQDGSASVQSVLFGALPFGALFLWLLIRSLRGTAPKAKSGTTSSKGEVAHIDFAALRAERSRPGVHKDAA